MKVLLTGGFGTVGLSVLDLFIAENHEVSVFEINNKKNKRKAKKHSSHSVSVFYGDLRNISDVEKAIAGQDVIVHCAAIVPPYSNENRKLCFDINVGGTQNIVNVIKNKYNSVPLVFISSASVMGPTQDREPFVSVNDHVNPIDNYSQSKVDAENYIKNSGIRYCILRLGAVMISNIFNNLKQLKLVFDIPLSARCEVVHEDDVAAACVHASEIILKSKLIDGSLFFIGGGKQNGCQITALQMYNGVFTPIGIKVPSASLFCNNLNNYYIDWYDTEQAQNMLNFQNHTFADYSATLKKKYRLLVPFIKLCSPFINIYFSSKSPYKIKK